MKSSEMESSMQDRRIAAFLVVALILLASSVTLYSYVTAPRSKPKIVAAVEDGSSLAWWGIQRIRAAAGNPEAMYRIGLKMQRSSRNDRSASGIPFDDEEGRRLVRVAADRGFLPAQVEVWRMDGGSTEQLKSLLPAEPAVYLDQYGFWNEMTVNPASEGVRRCDAGLYIYGEGVSFAGFALYAKWVRYRSEKLWTGLERWMKQGRAEFMRRCVLKGVAAPLPRRRPFPH